MANDYKHHSLFVPPLIWDHIQGVLSASVVLVMYGDYECYQSANIYRLIKATQQQLSPFPRGDGVCFIFRHFPQMQIHPHSQRAAEAAEAAAMQGQFWQMHEMLFIHQQMLENGYLVEYADHLGLDIPRFLQDLSNGVCVKHIIADIQSGYRSGVEAAPALFVNGIRYRERWTIGRLIAAIVAATNQRF